MSSFTDFDSFITEDFNTMIEDFRQEFDNLDYLFEEQPGAAVGDLMEVDYADAERAEEYASDDEYEEENCDYEPDEEITVAPSGNNNINNSNTTGEVQPQQGPTREELEDWQAQKLEALQKKLTSARSNINKLKDKIDLDESIISSKQAEYTREWDARNMGERELQQILDAKGKVETQLTKKQALLQKAVGRAEILEKEEYHLLSNPLEAYMKAFKPAVRKRKTRSTAQSQTDPFYKLDEGDDSLSEYDGPEARASSKRQRKNAASACRRCKANKVKCDMKRGQCTHCRLLNKRCRYNDPWKSDRQLRPYQLLETETKLVQSQKEVAYYQQLSLTSVLADNPLSGITGYGPRPATCARQNYARLNRGLDPIIRPAVAAWCGRNGTGLVPRDRKEIGVPRQVTPVKAALLPPPAPQWEIGTHWIHHTVPPTNPVKRGRKPGQKSMKRSSSESIQSLHHVPEAEATPVKNMQNWWKQQLLASGRRLPVNKDFTPQWPAWIYLANEKQQLWFGYMLGTRREVPLVIGREDSIFGSELDVLEPRWPGWTTTMEEPLGDQNAAYVLSLLGQGQEIHEIMNEDGTGQGKIDWIFYLFN